MLPAMQLLINFVLQQDNEFIHMAQGTDAGRVVVSSFNLWIPRITPEDSFLDSFVD